MKHDCRTDELTAAAWAVQERAYAPYSEFRVGAALLTTSGEIFVGCNVENCSFGLTCCAERSAVHTAVAAGCRSFEALVLVADGVRPAMPCGACRQVLAEFAPHLPVLSLTRNGATVSTSVDELLPQAFTPSDLPDG